MMVVAVEEEMGKSWDKAAAIPSGKQREMCSWNPNLNLKHIYPWEPRMVVGFHSTISAVLYHTDIID